MRCFLVHTIDQYSIVSVFDQIGTYCLKPGKRTRTEINDRHLKQALQRPQINQPGI